jgi:ADP-heptose:LPS heptosyltransferase
MNQLKFYVKLAVIKARAFLLWLRPVRVNMVAWEDRVLIINLDMIGDVVMFTAVLKHYRAAMPGKKLYLLLNGSSGVSPVLVRDYVDEVLMVDTNAFKSDPRYGYGFIKKLRQIGFATVVEQNPGMEFVGKTIAVTLGAKEVVGYHGFAIDEVFPPSANFALGLRYFRRVLSKKFTKMIPTIPEPRAPKRLANMISHYAAIFEGVTGQRLTDLVPRLPEPLPSDEAAKKILAENHIEPFSYCLLSLGTSTARKEWPVERFVALGKILALKNIPIVLTGGKKDIPKSKEFAAALGGNCLDLTGKTSILEAASLVRFSLLTMSNDTSISHFAIAFKRPSFTITWLANPGRTTVYGYPGLNVWVFKEPFPCFADNGRCAQGIGPDEPAPCIAAITVEEAEQALRPLLDRALAYGGRSKPEAAFSLGL